MKRLKRVLALTLAAVMLFTLGGCKKKTPEEVLEAATKKMSKVTSADMSGNIKMKMSSTSSTSSSLEMNMGLKMKATDMTSEDMKMDMDMTMGQMNSTGVAGAGTNYADQVKFESMSGTMTVNKDRSEERRVGKECRL